MDRESKPLLCRRFFYFSSFVLKGGVMSNRESLFGGMIKSLGLVFGDIGTSPIYTITVVFLLTKPTEFNVIGVLSLIAWTMMLLVTVEYAWLAMSLGKKGEGGTIVLKELLVPLLRTGRKVYYVALD
jgi:KUP system potassium uptake protein